jgi:uncharacterized membrane protein
MFKKVLRALGIWGYIAFGVLALLFVLGETIDDPGTSNGPVLVASWLIPLAILMTLVLFKVPCLKQTMFGLAAVLLLASVWIAIDPHGWLDFKFTNGPVIGIATLVFTFVLAWYARSQQMLAGILMIVVSAVPLVVEAIAQGFVHWGGSSVALQFPGVLAGILIWASSSER